MIMTRDYIDLAKRSKAIQRDLVVREIFRGQTALARLLGVTQSTVNHVIWFRRRSERIEKFVADRVKRARPDLLDLWQIPVSHRKAA